MAVTSPLGGRTRTRDRAHLRLRSLLALGRPLLLFGVIWLLGLTALAVVTRFQSHVDTNRQAQRTIDTLQNQVGNLSYAAFSPALAAKGTDPAAQTNSLLTTAKGTIRASLATLSRLGEKDEAARIETLALRYYPVIEQTSVLEARGESGQAIAVFGRDLLPAGHGGQLVAELKRASDTYGADAARSRRVGEIVTAATIFSMLVAFSFVLSRVIRLSRERRNLLVQSRVEALTDTLTGLANRRKLFSDMKELLDDPPAGGLTLGMFDLNGFKSYNDTFGHPAGDLLLANFGLKLARAVDGRGSAYRIGGDEFCVIVPDANAEDVLAAAEGALSEHGKRFDVTCARGSVVVSPNEMTLEDALQKADQRLYSNKRASQTPGDGEGHDVLLRVLAENSLALAQHLSTVGRLAEAVARELGLPEEQVTLTRLTAELHDVGKTAIPDSILAKPCPLDDQEWEFMRRHTIIGQRILAAAPALAQIAPLVRSTHERADGKGYPDGLRLDEIPLSSRIVAVVDAYDAMTSDRPYAPPLMPEEAMAEIERCAGTQFDPVIVKAFDTVWHERGMESGERAPRDPVGIAA